MTIATAPIQQAAKKEEPDDESLSAFAHDTTIHGFKYLFGTSFFRKFIWFLLVVAAMFLTGVQVKQKIDQFQENPIMTNIDIEYATEMAFPAVAICNTNQYRISIATMDLYPLIVSAYERGSNRKNVNVENYRQNINKIHSELLDSREYMKHAGHQIEDMLLDCRWPNGTNCTKDDFVVFFNDFGLCYQINFDQSKPFIVNGAGSDKALYMLINLEDYERMPGPDRTTGLKLVIYNQTNIPLVSFKAIDLPPGYHAQIAMNYVERQKVNKKDGGNCGDQTAQEYFTQPEYTVETCRLNRLFLESQSHCKCKSYNTPNNEAMMTGNITSKKYCTIEEHFQCVIRYQELTGQNGNECWENCTSIAYPVTLSFAKLPIDVIVEDASSAKNKMIEKFAKATEARARNQNDQVNQFNQIYGNLTNAKAKMDENHLLPSKENFYNLFQRLINFRLNEDSSEPTCMNLTIQDPLVHEVIGDPEQANPSGLEDNGPPGDPGGSGARGPKGGGPGGPKNKPMPKYAKYFKPDKPAYPLFEKYAVQTKTVDQKGPPSTGGCSNGGGPSGGGPSGGGPSGGGPSGGQSSADTTDLLKLPFDELIEYIIDILYSQDEAERLKLLNITELLDDFNRISELFVRLTEFYSENLEVYEQTKFRPSLSDQDFHQIFDMLQSYNNSSITKKQLAEDTFKHIMQFKERFKEYTKSTFDNLYNLNLNMKTYLESMHAITMNLTSDEWEFFRFYLSFMDDSNLDNNCKHGDVGYKVCLEIVSQMEIFLPNGDWKSDVWRCLLDKKGFLGYEAQSRQPGSSTQEFSMYCKSVIEKYQNSSNETSDPDEFVNSYTGQTFAEWTNTQPKGNGNNREPGPPRPNRQAPPPPPPPPQPFNQAPIDNGKAYSMKEKYCISQWYSPEQYYKNFALPTTCRLKSSIDIFKYWNKLRKCTSEMFFVMDNLTQQLQTVRDNFTAVLNAYDKHLHDYLNSFEMADDFYSGSILSLNIFYADLSRQKYVQQRAYDMWSLFCDVGGTLGLFLGASIMSFAEILDWLLFAFFVRRVLGCGRSSENETKVKPMMDQKARPPIPPPRASLPPDTVGRRRTMSNPNKKILTPPLVDTKKEPQIEMPPTPVSSELLEQPFHIPDSPRSFTSVVQGVPGDKYHRF